MRKTHIIGDCLKAELSIVILMLLIEKSRKMSMISYKRNLILNKIKLV